MNTEQVRFNGEKSDIPTLQKTIAGIFVPAIRTEKGGFIFRVGCEENNGSCIIHFGMLPAILGGDRSYHYIIAIPDSCTAVLTGALNVSGELMLFPDISARGKSASPLLLEREKNGYIALYRDFTRLLTTCGLSIDTPLHSPTIQVLGELLGGIFKGKTVGDIAGL